jgi:hypothetical protein
MLKDLVLKLKYLGVIPQSGFMEYGFRIENEDKSYRLVIVTIEDSFFQNNDLMIQEAPDLCYQKVLTNLNDETADSPVPERIPVTETDVVQYREAHPNTKLRKHG